MTLVEQLRAIGLGMGAVYPPHTSVPDEQGQTRTTRRYVCWTTDEAKAHEAQELGATLVPYQSLVEHPAYSGWEVTVVEVVS
jgi:hypothetical protein